jgi:hypothetical protein
MISSIRQVRRSTSAHYPSQKPAWESVTGRHNDNFELSSLWCQAGERQVGLRVYLGSLQATEVFKFANSRGDAWTWLSM